MARHPQSDQSAVHLTEILSNRDSSLGGVLKRAGMLLQLQQLLAGSADPSLATRFQVANIRETRLILLVPPAAWATRLRMQTPQLLQILHQAGFTKLREIETRVAPLVVQPSAAPSGKPLSESARQALEHMARLRAKSED